MVTAHSTTILITYWEKHQKENIRQVIDTFFLSNPNSRPSLSNNQVEPEKDVNQLADLQDDDYDHQEFKCMQLSSEINIAGIYHNYIQPRS